MKFTIQIIVILLVGYAAVCAAMYFFQEKMQFFPMGAAFGSCPAMDRYGATAVRNEGIRYYFKPRPGADARIVVFHGNAGSACDRTYFFDLLSGINAEIFVFEYPGYGEDGEKPAERRMLAKALELVDHIGNDSGTRVPVFLLGESMGTGVATWVSSQTAVSGLILISAFTSLADVAAHHYPWLPVKHLMKHRFTAKEWAKQNPTPAILFHGSDDDIIPIAFARRQAMHFSPGTRLVEIEGSGHNDIIDTGFSALSSGIRQFVGRHSGAALPPVQKKMPPQ